MDNQRTLRQSRVGDKVEVNGERFEVIRTLSDDIEQAFFVWVSAKKERPNGLAYFQQYSFRFNY